MFCHLINNCGWHNRFWYYWYQLNKAKFYWDNMEDVRRRRGQRARLFFCIRHSVHTEKWCWRRLNFSVCIAYPDLLIHRKYRCTCHDLSSLEARIIGRQVHLLVIWHFPVKSHCLQTIWPRFWLVHNPPMHDRIFIYYYFVFHFEVFGRQIFIMIANAPLYYNVDLFFWKTTSGDKQNSTLSLMRVHSAH